MTAEPDFLSQNGDLKSGPEQMDWYLARRAEAVAKGARWHRYSFHPEIKYLILYEGWHVMPVDADGNLDEGEPRWQMSADIQ